MSNAQAVTDSAFQKEVLESEIPVLVDFWASWCPPCRRLGPIVNEIAGEYTGKLKVLKLDVDANQETTSTLGVQSIPTLLVFKGGRQVAQIIGLQSKEQLLSKITPYLS